ncbi:hypothetical protein, partial [Methylobacterium tarhaniae]|uniref:hypothetical protein n=1 Tax=Methylobacterium tarhaniae TaxID=1187852 RepID=UPI003D06DED7
SINLDLGQARASTSISGRPEIDEAVDPTRIFDTKPGCPGPWEIQDLLGEHSRNGAKGRFQRPWVLERVAAVAAINQAHRSTSLHITPGPPSGFRNDGANLRSVAAHRTGSQT